MNTSNRTLVALGAVLLLLPAAFGRTAGEESSSADEKLAALVAEVGPDWEVVTDYMSRQREWMRHRLNSLGPDGDAETSEDGEEASGPPDPERAAAAAISILEEGGTHERSVDAAQFLTNQAAMTARGDEYAYRGAKALLEYVPDFGAWGMTLSRMNMLRRFRDDGESSRPATDRFFEELASEAEDPVLRAAGRYYLALGRMAAVNAEALSEDERTARKEAALDAAEGLSAGVEDEALLFGMRMGAGTFADAEADLIRSIRHATVGSVVADLSGSRMDGVEEALADYRGRIVLLDFWATWCKPCIAALPTLRELVADLPADRFVLLAVSVDAELETAVEFMEEEPMPWVNWHVGMTSELTKVLDVSAFPTYMLLDEQGRILARTSSLPDDFLALIEETVR
ncbi:MAG: TlpA disulfide reductase family protein [Acidobacteria bacterium]|nr:TlpA disulfide reductase family protein [Acidobacteriota bacterium]MXZ39447.1 TlpA family protein disulfide reductase [Holophagales bacterium]